MGGLGNQLFQYAAGKSLAIKNRTSLVIDTSFLNKKGNEEIFTPRELALDAFNISAPVVNDFAREHLKLDKTDPINKLRRKFLGYSTIYDYDFDLKPGFFDSGKNVILEGYFQSEEYFSGIKDVLRSEFTLRSEQVDTETIRQQVSVGIHFRRGDYSDKQNLNALHGTCDISYYEKAIAYLKSKLKEPVFYIFSDDISWVKENFKAEGNFIFMENKGRHAHLYDFEMLKSCRHQVIANSTFSWWAAWLNANAGKIVIAPARWFNNRAVKHNIIPSQWIQL